MTLEEAGVIVGGAFLGFWIVGAFIRPKTENKTDHDQFKKAENSSSENEPKEESQFRYEKNNNGDTQNWYDVLEVSPEASKDQIVVAYKKKISLYHPDKVANLGKELQELAELKSKRINGAYDYAMKLRG